MATVISAYYLTNTKKVSFEVYKQFIKNFVQIPCNLVLFTDERSLEIIQDLMVEDRIKIIILPIDQFECSPFDWEKQYEIDREKHLHCVELYKIWAEKIFFMKRVAKENPFNSKYFLWCDAGSFRDPRRIETFKSFPLESTFVDSQIIMSQIADFTAAEKQNIELVDERFNKSGYDRIAGGSIGGTAEMIDWFADELTKTLTEFQENNVFFGKDQIVYNFMVLRNPDKFKILKCRTINGYNYWFMFHMYYSGIV